MIRNSIIALVLTLFGVNLVHAAGTVSIFPANPQAGASVEIEYKPGPAEKAWFGKSAQPHVVVFAFSDVKDLPEAIESQLKNDGKRWTTSVLLPSNSVFVMLKVGDGKQYDTNDDVFWSAMIHDATGKPVRGAAMKAAQVLLGQMPAELRCKQDIDEAAAILTKEVQLHSRNVAAQINLVLLNASRGEMPQEEATARLNEFVRTTLVPATADDALALSAAFRALQKEGESHKIILDASQRFPGSKVSEQLELEEINRVNNIDDFLNRAMIFLNKYPQSSLRGSLIESAINSASKQGAYSSLLTFIERVTHLPAIAYYQAVNYIGAQDSLRSQAMELIQKGLKAVDDDQARFFWIGKSEWNHQQMVAKSQLLFVQGAIQRFDGKNQEAISSLKESVNTVGGQADPGVYEMLIATLVAQSDNPGIIQYAEMALKNGASSPMIQEAFVNALVAGGRSKADAEALVLQHKKTGQSAVTERLKREMLFMPMVDGEFASYPGGEKTRIADWKGKVVLIDYWATWCGPCRKSFPSLQKLYEKYKDNPNVVFAVVNVWERDNDRTKIVKDFLSNNPTLTFPMYIDKDDSVVKKYGVTGIPTKFFLGKDGRIQFKEVGLLPDEQFIEEASQKIELLLNQ